MKYSGAITMTMAALSQLVNANFDLYHVSLSTGGVTDEFKGWHVYEAEATCDFTHEWVWRESGDVSGNKFGVRCVGSACDYSEVSEGESLDIIEMNFNSEEHHWTYYKERDGALVDLSDNQVGRCYLFPGPTLECGQSFGRILGYRNLRCETETTADQINAGKPSKRRAARDFSV